MQFLTRLLIVVGVLSALGYGSYAFGKYVLSARLFGPQGAKAPITASAGTLQTPDEVDVKIQPAQPETETPRANTAAPRVTKESTPDDPRVVITPADDNDSNSSPRVTADKPAPEATPRRKRRRRPRPTSRPATKPAAQTPPQRTTPLAREENTDASPAATTRESNNDSSAASPAPRADNDSNDAVPRRRRELRTDTVPAPETRREPAPRVDTAPRREPAQRNESPIPVPEGARRNSESPIPVPQ